MHADKMHAQTLLAITTNHATHHDHHHCSNQLELSFEDSLDATWVHILLLCISALTETSAPIHNVGVC